MEHHLHHNLWPLLLLLKILTPHPAVLTPPTSSHLTGPHPPLPPLPISWSILSHFSDKRRSYTPLTLILLNNILMSIILMTSTVSPTTPSIKYGIITHKHGWYQCVHFNINKYRSSYSDLYFSQCNNTMWWFPLSSYFYVQRNSGQPNYWPYDHFSFCAKIIMH